jgi:hypothetical protein
VTAEPRAAGFGRAAGLLVKAEQLVIDAMREIVGCGAETNGEAMAQGMLHAVLVAMRDARASFVGQPMRAIREKGERIAQRFASDDFQGIEFVTGEPDRVPSWTQPIEIPRRPRAVSIGLAK